MNPIPAEKVLTRVAEGAGRLLGVRREPMPGAAGSQESRVLRLIFDLGPVDLLAGPGGELLAERPEGSDAPPVDAAEEEPWWALLGCPLARVQPHEGSSLLVQFRADADSPRIFVIEARGEGVGLTSLV
jgi:hypothetical protein